MNRIYNFSAGPSMLPLPVLERAASELVCVAFLTFKLNISA